MFKIKKFMSLALVCSMMTSVVSPIFAEEYQIKEQPMYAINENFVIIDYVAYEINDNTILYDSITYEINNSTLISYDYNDNMIIIPIPIEENKITDTDLIEELNESDTADLNYENNARSLYHQLYTGKVDYGIWKYDTPLIPVNNLTYYFTVVSLSFADSKSREFTVIYYQCDEKGDWYEYQIQTFAKSSSDIVFNNLKLDMSYHKFTLGNLTDEASYTYTILGTDKLSAW